MGELVAMTGVTKGYPARKGRLKVLQGASFRLLAGERLGILAPPSSGKTTLCALLCGATLPDQGMIRRSGAISWPLGTAQLFHPGLSARENIRLIAMAQGLSAADRIESLCRLLTGFEAEMHAPMRTLAASARLKLAFALPLAFPFDVYLADEIAAPGAGTFRSMCLALLIERVRGGGLVFCSSNRRLLDGLCNEAAAMRAGRIIRCADFDDAARCAFPGEGEGVQA